MGWRERFGGDDERAQIAARARALLAAADPGGPPERVPPLVGPGADRVPTLLPSVSGVDDVGGARSAVGVIGAAGVAGMADVARTAVGPTGAAGDVVDVAVDAALVAAPSPAPRRGGWVPNAPGLTAATFDPAPSPGADAYHDIAADLRAGSAGAFDVGRFPAADLFAGRGRGVDGFATRTGDVDDLGDPPRRADRSEPRGRGDTLRSLRDRVRWDPGRRGLVAVAAVVVVAGSVAGGLLVRGGSTAVTLAAASGTAPSDASVAPVAGADPAPSAAAASVGPSSSVPAGTVTVDVAGLVVAPGVYTLPAGSRVEDALTAAGGAQPGADLSTVNRARVLVDGEQLAVGVAGAVAAAPTASGTGGAAAAVPAGLVDLNTANAADLDALPGVGPVLAQAILDWRTEHGRFATVDDLDQVSGIGPATFADLRSLVTV